MKNEDSQLEEDSKHNWFTSLLKLKSVRIPLIILIWTVLIAIISLALGVIFFKMHVVIAGIDINPPASPKDTFYIHDTEKIHDTIRIKSIDQAKTDKKSIPIQQTSKTPKQQSKFDLKGADFNGPTQVGDNNTQNINAERVLSPSELESIINQVRKVQLENDLGLCVDIFSTEESSVRIISQIEEYLIMKGYTASIAGHQMGRPFNGCLIRKSLNHSGCIEMVIGQ